MALQGAGARIDRSRIADVRSGVGRATSPRGRVMIGTRLDGQRHEYAAPWGSSASSFAIHRLQTRLRTRVDQRRPLRHRRQVPADKPPLRCSARFHRPTATHACSTSSRSIQIEGHTETRDMPDLRARAARSDGKLVRSCEPAASTVRSAWPAPRRRAAGTAAPGQRPQCGMMMGIGKSCPRARAVSVLATDLVARGWRISVDRRA
jgi:hypothetical protein